MAGLSVAGLLALGTWIGRQTEMENYLREAEILLSQDNRIVPWSWSPEPETLAVTEFAARFGMGFVHFGGEPVYEASADVNIIMPTFSPDGTHFAYLLSTAGGDETRNARSGWSRTGSRNWSASYPPAEGSAGDHEISEPGQHL